jgi:hypothetical protein
MSKYDADLRQRLANGTDIAETRKWFMRIVAGEPEIGFEFTKLE